MSYGPVCLSEERFVPHENKSTRNKKGVLQDGKLLKLFFNKGEAETGFN